MVKGEKNRKVFYSIFVLVVLLVLAVGYIGFDKYSDWKVEKDYQRNLEIYQQGASYGYEQAVIQLANQVATCQQVPLMIGNQTINVFAVECLQQAQAQQASS